MKRTSLVIVDSLVQTESRVTKFVNLIGIFDVIADLTINDPCRMNESGIWRLYGIINPIE